MNRGDMVKRVRAYTRDVSASIFRTIDITDFINEGVDRIKSRISQLKTMQNMDSDDQLPSPLPTEYHYMIPVYAASRCFGQDERHYQASTLMNEFETKLEELYSNINDGTTVIVDALGVVIETSVASDYVRGVYFTDGNNDADIDDGVDGVS